MGSPWELAIPQAMQRHGGSNRSVPKTAQPQACRGASLPEQTADGADRRPEEAEMSLSIVPERR